MKINAKRRLSKTIRKQYLTAWCRKLAAWGADSRVQGSLSSVATTTCPCCEIATGWRTRTCTPPWLEWRPSGKIGYCRERNIRCVLGALHKGRPQRGLLKVDVCGNGGRGNAVRLCGRLRTGGGV